MEYLSQPKWQLVYDYVLYRATVSEGEWFELVENICKELIRLMLKLHYTCNRATYYDVNGKNVFIDTITWERNRRVTLKFVDFGGLFFPSLTKDIHVSPLLKKTYILPSPFPLLENTYFLPSPEMYDMDHGVCNRNLFELYRNKKMIPVFYGIICSVNASLCMCSYDEVKSKCLENENDDNCFEKSSKTDVNILKVSRGKTIIANILNSMGRLCDLKEQQLLYQSCIYQTDFVYHLFHNNGCLQNISLIRAVEII